MQYSIFPDDHRMPKRNGNFIQQGRKISSCDRYQGILFEQDLRAWKMNFYHRFSGAIAYEHVRNFCSISIHGASRVNSPFTIAITPSILNSIQQAGFDNG